MLSFLFSVLKKKRPPLFLNFKIIIDSQEVAKINQVVPYTYHSAFLGILHNVLHYQKQEIDIDTKPLTKLIQLTRL